MSSVIFKEIASQENEPTTIHRIDTVRFRKFKIFDRNNKPIILKLQNAKMYSSKKTPKPTFKVLTIDDSKFTNALDRLLKIVESEFNLPVAKPFHNQLMVCFASKYSNVMVENNPIDITSDLRSLVGDFAIRIDSITIKEDVIFISPFIYQAKVKYNAWNLDDIDNDNAF